MRVPSIRKGYVDGPFGQIHYYRTGDGPSLILAHQSPVSGRMFERSMPHFAQAGIRAFAVDTPGYGNSDVPPEPPRIADYADAYLAVLDGLGLAKADLLGHHTGAAILCNLAARYPDRVRSLVLSGPPLFTKQELTEIRERIAPGPHEIRADGSHLQARWDRRAGFSKGWTDKLAMHRRLVDQLWAGETAWYGHNAAFEYEMIPDFEALKGPVLLLTNTGEGPNRLARRAHEMRPEFAFHELSGGTHDIVDEQPEAWTKVVADFVLQRG